MSRPRRRRRACAQLRAWFARLSIRANAPIFDWFPELRLISSPAERAYISNSVWEKHWRPSRPWLYLGSWFLCMFQFLVVYLLLWPLVPYLRGFRFELVPIMILSGACACSTYLILVQFVLPRMRYDVRLELRSRGHRICLRCGYDLRGQIEPRCAECGTPEEAAENASRLDGG